MNKFGPYQLVDNLQSPPIIGNTYHVRTVFAKMEDGIFYSVPIIGPIHNDFELIGFPYTHVHYDHRFTPVEIYEQMMDSRYPPETRVVMCNRKNDEYISPFICQRDFQPFDNQIFHFVLESVPGHGKMHNFRCPHWGTYLRNEVIKDGIVQCPLHGLRFDVQTGNLVKRYNREQVTTHGMDSCVLSDCNTKTRRMGEE